MTELEIVEEGIGGAIRAANDYSLSRIEQEHSEVEAKADNDLSLSMEVEPDPSPVISVRANFVP